MAEVAGQLAAASEGADVPAPVQEKPVEAAASADRPKPAQCALTLFQANLLVAMLGGFWARRADGHPGPDLMGRGLMLLRTLVEWERLKKTFLPKDPKQPRRKPG